MLVSAPGGLKDFLGGGGSGSFPGSLMSLCDPVPRGNRARIENATVDYEADCGVRSTSRAWRPTKNMPVEAGILLSSPLVSHALRRKSASLRLPNDFPSFPCSANPPKNGGLLAYGPNVANCSEDAGSTSRGS